MTISARLKRIARRRLSGLDRGSDDSRPTEVEATKRRTEILIETQRLLRITRGNESLATWCDECGATVWMLSPEEAAVLCGNPTRLIYRLVEARCLHLIERPDGLLVCLKSLEASLSGNIDVTQPKTTECILPKRQTERC